MGQAVFLLSCLCLCEIIPVYRLLDVLGSPDHSLSFQVLEFFHFACTSEDVNNLAHALMLKEAMNTAIFPVMDDLIKAICNMAKANAHIPMLSRTHGQVICYIWHIFSYMLLLVT